MMELLSDPQVWIAFLPLTSLELVLGIDNLVFIAILADKLPEHQRDKARRAFKAKVEAQFREISKKFPTARGLKSVAAIRELTAQIAAFKVAS